MPIPVATHEDAVATFLNFESSLESAVSKQADPEEVYWAAEDLLLLANHSRFPDIASRASGALVRIMEATAPGPNRDAIGQAIAGVEYRYPEGSKRRRNPSPPARVVPQNAGSGERPTTIN